MIFKKESDVLSLKNKKALRKLLQKALYPRRDLNPYVLADTGF